MTGKPLYIAMPTPSFLPNMGGMEVGLHNIATRLALRGHKPHVIIPASQYKALKKSGIETSYEIDPFWPKMSSLTEKFPTLGLYLHGFYFKAYQHNHKPDIWHNTMIYPTGTGLYFGLRNQVPALARAAGNDIQINEEADYGIRRHKAVDRLIRKWGHGLPAYVAITNTVRAEYEALGIKSNNIFSIPNGVDLNRFKIARDRPYIEKRYGIPQDKFLFLSVGRNHIKKNYNFLLDSFAELIKQNPRCTATLAIAGHDSLKLKERVTALGLKEHVFLIENIGLDDAGSSVLDLPHHDLVQLYKSADCFVFPSLIETFGIAIIEAMAAGLPCLISDAPGCRDITENGQYALTFDPHDPIALALHMGLMINDPAVQITWRKKSMIRAAQYDWDHIVDQYEELYRKLMGD